MGLIQVTFPVMQSHYINITMSRRLDDSIKVESYVKIYAHYS